MPEAVETMEVATDLTMRRAVTSRPTTVNDAERTVELTWATGATVERFGPLPGGGWGRYIEELDMRTEAIDLSRLKSGAPLLNAHSAWDLADIIGVVESAAVRDGKGFATVRFSDRDDVAPIWSDVRAGIIRNVSVGYQIEKFEDVTKPGDQTRRLRATRWQPMELSLVPIPADAGAQVRAAGETSTTLAENPADPGAEKMTEQVQSPAVDEAAVNAARAEARNAERSRVAQITALAARHKVPDLAQAAIESDVSVDAFRGQVLDELAARDAARPTDNTIRVQMGRDEVQKFRDGISDWLLIRSGASGLVGAHEKRSLDAGEFRGLRLVEVARMCLERGGVSTRGMDIRTMVGEAFVRADPTQGTGDFAALLENTMHKTLMAAYSTQAVTWRRFCGTGSVSDFRAHPFYKRGLLGNLLPVNEHGEFQRVAIPDGAKESLAATTKGMLFGLTRQAIINDDMSAFNGLPSDAGRAAATTIETDVFAMLAQNTNTGPTMNEDGTVLFHVNHANIGTTAAPTMASFAEARTMMASQRDPAAKDYIDIRPTIWLGPLSVLPTAEAVNASQYNPDVSNKFQMPNTSRGIFSDLVGTPRLSGTRWYAFAEPSVAPSLMVVFLDGNQTPFLDSKDGWTVDGVEWKTRLDYGVGAIDWRPAFTNAGQ